MRAALAYMGRSYSALPASATLPMYHAYCHAINRSSVSRPEPKIASQPPDVLKPASCHLARSSGSRESLCRFRYSMRSAGTGRSYAAFAAGELVAGIRYDAHFVLDLHHDYGVRVGIHLPDT